MGDFIQEEGSLLAFPLEKISQEVMIKAGLIFLLAVVGIPLLLRLFAKLIGKSKAFAPIQSYILSTIRILLWCVALLMLAESFGIPVNSIVALLGVAGFAVSLALQNTLSNLAGGLQVLLSKPFAVGDYIDTDQGSGTVAEIALAYTKLQTFDNKEVLVPNYLMASSKIINHTAAGIRRVDLVFPASYDAATAAVRKSILSVTEGVPEIHLEPAPVVYLSEYGDSSISYSLRVWTDAPDYWKLYYYLMEEVREAFLRDGIEIPYSYLNVRMTKEES